MSLLLDALKKAEQSQNNEAGDQDAKQDIKPDDALQQDNPEAQTTSLSLTENESDYSLGDFSHHTGPEPPAAEQADTVHSETPDEAAIEFDQEFDEDHVNRLNSELSQDAQAAAVPGVMFADEVSAPQQPQRHVYYQLQGTRRGLRSKKMIAGASVVLAAVFAGLSYYIYQALNDLNASVTNPITSSARPGNRHTPQQTAPRAALPASRPVTAKAQQTAVKPKTGTEGPAAVPTTGSTPRSTRPAGTPAVTGTEPDAKPVTKEQTPVTGTANKPAAGSTDQGQHRDQARHHTAVTSTGQTAPPAKDAAQAPRPAQKDVTPGEIKIVKYNTHSRLDRNLLNAYQLYRSGKYTAAQQAYQQILSLEPNQRDALLGLAAIAIRQKNLALAAAYYKTLLRLDPKDSAALSGLMSVQAVPANANTIAHLKQLLRSQPTSAHLHYSLGNLYAAKQRWLEAQNSYFNAHRYDRNNAVYAYNLAISLDRLGQGRAALPYYQLSLTLTKNRLNYANRLVVKRRIRQLKNGS